MRTSILSTLSLLLLTGAVHAQVLPANEIYTGTIPHRENATVVFRVAVGQFTLDGPIKMQLLAREVATDEVFMAFMVNAQSRESGLIKATFPFGGRFRGRYHADQNIVTGRFTGFSRRGEPSIPTRRFELTVQEEEVP
jgi:hypothetical protein